MNKVAVNVHVQVFCVNMSFHFNSWRLKKEKNLQPQLPDIKNNNSITNLYLSGYKGYY